VLTTDQSKFILFLSGNNMFIFCSIHRYFKQSNCRCDFTSTNDRPILQKWFEHICEILQRFFCLFVCFFLFRSIL